ncbi:uncharacterized protein B0P05DRAFT_591088 [Gilbertella persicaria]|uniref:uncharacterized protein n=1 Tax=Gilbertella persicaria TaxID=101096 RepID=UPI002220DA44|nr:uncharacterized protein B0P05DRAFT_591088 [Gilbertella persicaria]KAI8058933.1 hypothetical protein B0P05DRAFT_591088 [Gilbertella persicaria]
MKTAILAYLGLAAIQTVCAAHDFSVYIVPPPLPERQNYFAERDQHVINPWGVCANTASPVIVYTNNYMDGMPAHIVVTDTGMSIPCVYQERNEDGHEYYTCAGVDVTTTTTVAITTAIPNCSNKEKIFGKKKDNGYKGDCCKSQADCWEECINGKCNGPTKATTTTATTIKKTATSRKPTATCISDYKDKKKGNGPKNACCPTQWDCKEDCINGKCN